MSIQKSSIEIPAEWLESLKNHKKRADPDEERRHKQFIAQNYEEYPINALAKAIGKSRTYVDNRIKELKEEGVLT